MNVKLLKKVRDYIAKHPEKYDQSEWCGTACCVAGHAAVLSGRMTHEELISNIGAVEDTALDALDLNWWQAKRLFSATWPGVADGRFRVFPDMPASKRSRIAVRRINHFIRTKGAE